MVDIIADGGMDFLGGQNAALIPDRIPANCYASAVNCSSRRASLTPRWGYERLTLVFENDGFLDSLHRFRSYREVFEGGKFQAMAPFSPTELLFVIAGHIWIVDVDTGAVTYLPIADGSLLDSTADRINWSAAGDRIVLFDYPARPVIVQGLSARRSDAAAYEVPIAVLGTQNSSRLFIANAGNEFTAGDPIGNLLTPNAPITFEEIMASGAAYYGQIFKTTIGYKPITYMGFLQSIDTSTGIGPLIIGNEDTIFAYGANEPRANWEAGQFGSVIVQHAGIIGPRAYINANSDAFFISKDGHIRALSMARNEAKKWSLVPISREVENWLICHDPDLLKYSVAAYFKNKLFFGVNQHRVWAEDWESRLPTFDYANAGMVVLELDNVSSFGETGAPAWAGLWTGVKPMDFATIEERCFVVSKDTSYVNRVYEINPEIHYDTADDNIRYVRSVVYTREMDFKDPFTNKEHHSFEMNMDVLQGDFSAIVEYKPAHGFLFYHYGMFAHYAPWRTSSLPSPTYINGFAHHMRREITIGAPNTEECNEATSEIFKIFRKCQFRLTFQGIYWELHEFRSNAIPSPAEPRQVLCEIPPPVALPNEADMDWFVEEFATCQAKVT